MMPARRIMTLMLLLVAAVAAEGQPQARKGLMGYAWGTPLEEIRKGTWLDPIDTYGDYSRYVTGIQSLAGVRLEDCSFEFLQNRFSGVVITTRGHSQSQQLLAYLKRTFGEGHQENPFGWHWFSGDVHVAFDEDSAGDAYVYWYSLELYQRADLLRQQQR